MIYAGIIYAARILNIACKFYTAKMPNSSNIYKGSISY